jgi:hypothetical protein
MEKQSCAFAGFFTMDEVNRDNRFCGVQAGRGLPIELSLL